MELPSVIDLFGLRYSFASHFKPFLLVSKSLLVSSGRDKKLHAVFAGHVSKVFSFGAPVATMCQMRGTIRERNRRESTELKKYEGAGELVQLLVFLST